MNAQASQVNFSSIEFLDRVRGRDHQSIESLVRAYTDHLYRASLGMGFDSNSAQELVQRTWTTFHDVVPKFQAKSHVRTFLFGILYNKASEMRREKRRHDSDALDPIEEIMDRKFDETEHWSSPPMAPDRFLEGVETVEIVEECLEQLPMKQRMVFTLREVDGESTEEICNILDVSRTHLGVLLFRAKNRLRECIESKVGTD